MTTNKIFTLVLLASVWTDAVQASQPQFGESSVTLDQAVLGVQQQTGGKVLSAEPHEIGHRMEYRIKVLTPDGHVRVLAVPSETGKNSAFTQSPKNLSGKSSGSKEKH